MNDATQPSSAGVMRRAAVTVGAALLFLALQRLPLPFARDLLPTHYWSSTELLCVGALGLTPFLWSFLLVEAFAAAVPTLRALRHAGEEARRPLLRAAWILGTAFAAVQANSVRLWLLSTPWVRYGSAGELRPLESNAIVLTLVAGSVLCAALAEAVTRRGLGNGFGVLTAASALATLAGEVARRAVEPESLPLPMTLVVLAGIALAAAHFGARAGAGQVPVAVPTCGVIPVLLAASIPTIPYSLAGFFPALQRRLGALQALLGFGLVGVGIALGAAVALSRLFAGRTEVEAAWSRAAPGLEPGAVRGALARARRRSVAFAGTLSALPLLDRWIALSWSLTLGTVTGLAVVGAVGLDVLEDARSRRAAPGLVPAYALHRVYAVEPVLAALAAAGIPAVARNRRFRALFHFFAPYAPIELCVPPERVIDAAALCVRVAAGPAAPVLVQAAAAF